MSCIEYTPITGMTVEKALNVAFAKAIKQRKTVLANINDIVMIITPNSDMNKVLAEYHQKVNLRYEIADIKRAQMRVR